MAVISSSSFTVTEEIKCIDCGKTFQFLCPRDGYERWKDGALIQDAMPDLVDDHRELLISQTCGECFDNLFDEEYLPGGKDLDEDDLKL